MQRLKALSDGENEATILHWTLWEIHYTPTAPNAATFNIRIYTVNSIQTGKCLGQNSALKIVECRVIKAHICLYIARHWRLI